MPLDKSGSKESVGKNIAAEQAAGKPHKQAVAIALDVQRRAGGGKPKPAAEEEDKPEKALEGSWKRHPGTGKFVSAKSNPPSDSGGSGGWKAPGNTGKKTYGW